MCHLFFSGTLTSVCSRVNLNLAFYLPLQVSVLLSSALAKTDLDSCSLDHKPTNDLLRKSMYC